MGALYTALLTLHLILIHLAPTSVSSALPSAHPARYDRGEVDPKESDLTKRTVICGCVEGFTGIDARGTRLKVILQTEAAECGLACLAMVAAAHGNDVGLRELRLSNAVSLKGSTLSQIMGAAAKIHFICRPLRLDMEHLGQLRLPCILHWDLSHFVVLTRVGKRAATVIDPASGKKQLPLEAFSNHFTGVALELTPAADFKLRPKAKAISLSKLTGRITGARRSLGLVFALSIALQVFVLLAPFLMQWVVDHVLIAADRDLLPC